VKSDEGSTGAALLDSCISVVRHDGITGVVSLDRYLGEERQGLFGAASLDILSVER
jgi:hypothetical protein